jgi:hypothetical protein
MSDEKNNIGEGNSGHWNAGEGNSGHQNSGNKNSGDRNSGDWNAGEGNSGHRNSGHWNSGYGNAGHRNSGYANSGDANSGEGNSGYGNSCERSSGIFCTETPQLYCFNKPTDKSWNEIEHPYFKEFHLNKWIPGSKMTDEEKEANPDFKAKGGYLKTYTWEEAWQNYWKNSNEEEKRKVLNLPNFDVKIFKEITGIEVDSPSDSYDGKVIEVDGKKYRLEEIRTYER